MLERTAKIQFAIQFDFVKSSEFRGEGLNPPRYDTVHRQLWRLKSSNRQTTVELNRQIKRFLGYIRRNNAKVGVTMRLF